MDPLLLRRRCAEEALRRNRRHFETLIATAPVGVFETRADGTCIYVNDRWLQIAGLTLEQAIDDGWEQGLHPEDRAAVLQAWNEAMSSAGRFGKEYRFRRADGTVTWVWGQADPLIARGGRVEGYIGTITDITAYKQEQQARQAVQRKYRYYLEHEQDAIYCFEPPEPISVHLPLEEKIGLAAECILVECNTAFASSYGYEPRDVLDRKLRDIVTDAEERRNMLHLLMEGTDEPGLFDLERQRNGNSYWIELRTILEIVDDKIVRMWGSYRDITQSKLAHAAMSESEARLRLAIGMVNMAVFKQDRQLRYSWIVSPQFGYRVQDVLGKTDYELLSQEGAERAIALKLTAMETGNPARGEIPLVSGEKYHYYDLSVAPLKDSSGTVTGLLGAAMDISEQREARSQIEFLAYHDPLTQLPNRTLARDRLQMAIAHAERTQTKTALFFIDLDNFKAINDSLGHAVGDSLLQAVATRLRACIRPTDTMSRLGGDEFLIVLQDIRDSESVMLVMEKIFEQLRHSFSIGGHDLSTSVSVGIAVYPEDGKEFDSLLQRADTAMYHAKAAGRNTFRFFTEQMNAAAIEDHRLVSGLRRALERGEFVLHYQPQFDLNSGAVVGAEALLRWMHPERGLMMPGEFIRIAEDSGLILGIGEWVLRAACRQAVAWQRQQLPPLTVAVNLSALQFRRGDIGRTVLSALDESGLDARFLELELTESILIVDTEHVLSTVNNLKSRGLSFSIDDFGTGYSSLAYLKRLSVDKLKIDQSFVRNSACDADDAAIVQAVVQLAKSLRLRTIAEGVEDRKALDYLHAQGCDDAQGYYLGAPTGADEFPRYLTDGGSQPCHRS